VAGGGVEEIRSRVILILIILILSTRLAVETRLLALFFPLSSLLSLLSSPLSSLLSPLSSLLSLSLSDDTRFAASRPVDGRAWACEECERG